MYFENWLYLSVTFKTKSIMEIKIKYSIGDEFFWFKGQKIESGNISEIHIHVYEGKQIVNYTCRNSGGGRFEFTEDNPPFESESQLIDLIADSNSSIYKKQ